MYNNVTVGQDAVTVYASTETTAEEIQCRYGISYQISISDISYKSLRCDYGKGGGGGGGEHSRGQLMMRKLIKSAEEP